MNWVFKKANPPKDSGKSEATLYGDLWPMVRYLRAHEWSVFIVAPKERMGNRMYRVGTKLMSAEALTITYHRVHDRNERAKALAAQRPEGETEGRPDRKPDIQGRMRGRGSRAGNRPAPKRTGRRSSAGTAKGGGP